MIENVLISLKSYYKFLLTIIVVTSILIPTFIHMEKLLFMAELEKQWDHLYHHIEKGSNPIDTKVLLCENIGCFGYEQAGKRYMTAFGVDLHTDNWEKAKYHEFKETKEEFQIKWYNIPFIYDININSDEGTIVFKKNLYPQFIDTLETFLFVEIIILSIIMYLFSKLSQRERTLYKTVAEKESSLLNNIMTVYITENLHHELLTPFKVIMTKSRVLGTILKKAASRYDKNENTMNINDINKSKEAIDYISVSINQIHAVLESMRQAKMVKKNDDQTIYDIIEYAAGLIDFITTDEFNYDIDENLDKFILSEDLEVATFINILLNHIKNSVEAGSLDIIFKLTHSTNKCIKIQIIDNGNGIESTILKRLFSPNNSSSNSELRGNGLYINKNIMNRSNGNLSLISTGKSGTIFELKVQSKRFDINKKNQLK